MLNRMGLFYVWRSHEIQAYEEANARKERQEGLLSAIHQAACVSIQRSDNAQSLEAQANSIHFTLARPDY
jgi:hypothetical protein